jgi:hypothetical protein
MNPTTTARTKIQRAQLPLKLSPYIYVAPDSVDEVVGFGVGNEVGAGGGAGAVVCGEGAMVCGAGPTAVADAEPSCEQSC